MALDRTRARERVPASRYSSQAFFDREWERVWTRRWLLAGHVSALEGAGAFFTFEIGPESLLVVRGEDGVARAFYDVCQHRGSRLATAASGRTDAFVCPYHHFRYRLDGSLASAPCPEAFPGVRLEEAARLEAIACEERFGFVWVSMSEAPESIDAFLAPIAHRLARHHPERFTPKSAITVEVACNWKTSVDVNNEAFHLRSVHPELMDVIDDALVREELLGPHSSIRVPLGAPARRSPAGKPTAGLEAFMRSMGLDPASFGGPLEALRPALAQAARARAEKDGVDLSELDDEALVDKHQIHVFPNAQLNFTARSLEVFRHRPRGVDPLATLFDDLFFELAPRDSLPSPMRPRRVKHGEADLGPVMGPDVDLLPRLTKGMASRGFRGLLLSEREACIAHFHRVLDEDIFGT